VSYEIENGKIVHHWLIADQMILMEQLGLMNVPA
jgi:predicted ester cyclase